MFRNPFMGAPKVRRLPTVFNSFDECVGARPVVRGGFVAGLKEVYNAPNLRGKEGTLAAVRQPEVRCADAQTSARIYSSASAPSYKRRRASSTTPARSP